MQRKIWPGDLVVAATADGDKIGIVAFKCAPAAKPVYGVSFGFHRDTGHVKDVFDASQLRLCSCESNIRDIGVDIGFPVRKVRDGIGRSDYSQLVYAVCVDLRVNHIRRSDISTQWHAPQRVIGNMQEQLYLVLKTFENASGTALILRYDSVELSNAARITETFRGVDATRLVPPKSTLPGTCFGVFCDGVIPRSEWLETVSQQEAGAL